MKIVVLGASGMLGHLTALHLETLGFSVFRVARRKGYHEDTVEIDVMDSEALALFLDRVAPDVIINCIALLVGDSEKFRDKAIYLNSYLPQWLATRYKDTSTRIVQVSTDAVFDGKEGGYRELQSVNPTTFYGYTKYLGEIDNEKDITIRSAFWGPDWDSHKASLMNWFLQAKGNVSGYDRVVFNGVSSLGFAKFLEVWLNKPVAGIYHLVAQEPISKAELLQKLAKVFGKTDFRLVKDSQKVSNLVLKDTRKLEGFANQSYDEMLLDLYEWVNKYGKYYKHLNV